MNNQCDIIITYAWNRVGYNILRSLSSKGLKVVVADVSSYNITTVSNRKYGSFTYPDPINQEDEFIQVLIKNVNIYCPQMLIPTHDEGIINVAWHIYEIAALEIPIRHVHPDGECTNPSEDGLWETAEKQEEQKIDPRWEELRKILDNNNK